MRIESKIAERQRPRIKWSNGCESEETCTSGDFSVGVVVLSGHLNGCGQEIDLNESLTKLALKVLKQSFHDSNSFHSCQIV